MKVTILGSGCTAGTPKPGCDCGNCSWSRANGFERTRFSCLVESEGRKLLIDAGPDLRAQMLEHSINPREVDAILITHAHYDHVSGLNEFRLREPTKVYAIHGVAEQIKGESPHLGRRLDVEAKELMQPSDAAGFKAIFFDARHDGPCAGIALESEGKKMVFLPDSRLELNAEAEEVIRGADLLVVDGYVENKEQARAVLSDFCAPERINEEFKEGKITHGTVKKAKVLSERLGVKTAIGVHFSHRTRAHPELVKGYESEAFKIGFDGKQIEL